jgi:hypothetical protein
VHDVKLRPLGQLAFVAPLQGSNEPAPFTRRDFREYLTSGLPLAEEPEACKDSPRQLHRR